MRRALLYIVLFLQVMFMGHVQAQNGTVFPVDLNVTLTPPYGPCLDDYVGIGGNRFLCNVLFRDQMKDKTSPVFEYVIEMRVRTMGGSTMIKAWSEDHKAVLGAVEHFDGGRLMREFLSETNHTGGSTCLKEGPYTMTFRVYDAVSYNHGRGKGIPISQEFSFSVFVDKGAAPELFNPANKERLSTTTQMVNFQWQLPYVASGMNTYKFVLAKIPQGGNANTDIDNPSYQIRNESVTFPMVQVPVTTLFGYEAQGDGSYAWQVTVCDAEGKQRTNYENQGKSKVFTFTFNDEAWLPDSFVTVAPFVKSINKNLAKLTIDSVEVDNETGAARWTNANLGDADSYHGSIIEVRKKGQDKWTPYIAEELKSGDDEQQLPNLKKGVEYEARGQYYQMDNGDTVYAPYGEIVPFTVPSDIDTMNCADDLPALTDCGDAQPKEIHPGDTIIANGKRVFVDSVSYSGDRLSGSGHLDFPIIKFFKFRMQFKNIKVNCAGELVDGEITSVYDMTNAFILDLNNLTGKGNTGDETFNSTEPTVSKVKDLDKAKKTKQPGDYFEVEGEPNVIYSLDKDKNPVKIGTKLANWTSDTFTHANKMYNNEILLKFSNDRKDQGFDSSEEPYRLMAPSKYESVDGYWVPWLASNPGRVCVVKAKLEGGSISNVKDPEHDVKFVMPLSDGGLMELNTQYKGSGEFEITVMGSSKAGDKLEIYAVIKKTDGKNEEYVDAGRLYVPIYEYRTLKMTLVKVNGANASAVDKSSIESYLNEVYGRIGISFEVTVEEFQSEEAKEFLEDGLDVCGAGGFMTATTSEMRQLKSLYMDSKGGSVDEKRLYLFLVNKAQCTKEDSKIDPSAVCGDMPRNSKVGYLFAENAGDQASFNRTVAHELGHGAFTYEHPFDNAAYKTEQGTTHNLMDYVKDDELAYFQWQSTLGLNLTWGFLEGDEDAMNQNISNWVSELFQNISKNFGDNCSIYGQVFKAESDDSPQITDAPKWNNFKEQVGLYKYDNYDIVVWIETSNQNFPKKRENLSFEKGTMYPMLFSGRPNNVIICVDEDVQKKLYDIYKTKPLEEYVQALKNAIETCIKDADKNDESIAYNVLSQIQGQIMPGQLIEYYANGKAYILKNGNLELSSLTDADIENGEWSEPVDNIMRIESGSNGNLQLRAFGISKDLPIAILDGKQKTADLKSVSSGIKEATNKFLEKQNVTVEQPVKKPTVDLQSGVFPDGREIKINDDVSCFKLISEGIDVSKDFLKTARMPQKVYYDDFNKIKENKGNPTDNNIHAPPMVTGSLEAGCKAITDITSFVGFAYDMVFDSEARTEAWNGMKSIATEIGNDYSTVFPVLGDIVLEEATGANIEEYKSLTNSETDDGAKINIATRTSEQTVATIFMGASFIKKLPEMATKMSAKIATIKGWKNFENLEKSIAENLVKNLKSKLSALSPEECKKFFKDFENASEDAIMSFLNNPSLVDVWKKLDNLGAVDTWKKYGNFTIKNIRGFVDQLSEVLPKHKLNGKVLTENEYMDLIKKVDPNVPDAPENLKLTKEELKYLRQVRHELYKLNKPNENTVFQKTLNFFDENELDNYIAHMNNDYHMQVGGSIIIASDAKHLKTPKDIYRGQAMGYPKSPFGETSFESKPYYQIRYKTNDYDKAKIPVSGSSSADFDDFVKANGGENVYVATENKYPFTGNGNVPEAPEFLAKERQTVSEAIIVRIDIDGTEIPVAVKTIRSKTIEIIK